MENDAKGDVSTGEIMADRNKPKTYRTEKIDVDFTKEMRELAKFRYFQNLAKKEPSLPEMTRLVRRSPYWKNVIFDLRTKPKKEDVK